MRKVYLAFITIVTIVCILIGSYRNLVHSRSEYAESHPAEWEESEYEPAAEEHTWEFDEAISAVDVDLEVGNVSILEGSGFIEADQHDFSSYEISDGVLKIKQNPSYKNHWENTEPDPVVTDNMPHIWIYLPETDLVESVSVDLKAGTFDMSSVHPDNISINCDLGDIRLESVDFIHGQIFAKMGNITLESISFTDLTVDEKMGNIYIYSRSDLSGYEKNLSVKLGVLNMNGANIGRTVSSEGSDGKLSVANDMGDVDVSWDM